MQLRHLFWVSLVLSGCAGHKQHVRDPDRIAEEEDRSTRSTARHAAPAQVPDTPVKLVSREPAKDRWEMVGKIQGEADSDDTLLAGELLRCRCCR